MRKVDYQRVIPGCVGPRLAYHGFKYDENNSYPPQGSYVFSRTYWCAAQRVSIGPVEYDREGFIAQRDDCPTEVPQSLLLNREPGFRLWLSNNYIIAVLASDHRSLIITPHQCAGWVANQAIAGKPSSGTETNDVVSESAGEVETTWRFDGNEGLRGVLSKITEIVITDGLEWFEQQIADVRRYHEKLDKRRQASKR